VHHEFIPEGATVNKDRYKGMFTHLWETNHLMYSDMWVLLHTNFLVQRWLLMQEPLTKQEQNSEGKCI